MGIAIVFVMSFALALLVLTCGALAAIVYHLRRAPEGFEDEVGFHFSSSADNPLAEELDLPLGAEADIRAALFKGQTTASHRRTTPDAIGIPRIREAH